MSVGGFSTLALTISLEMRASTALSVIPSGTTTPGDAQATCCAFSSKFVTSESRTSNGSGSL